MLFLDNLSSAELQALREDGPVNVFMLDHDPRKAAHYHTDRHVVKMILECAQLLSTAWHCLDNQMYKPMGTTEADDPPSTPWLELVTAPAGLDRWAAAGEPKHSHWQLLGQRIYHKTHDNHPSAVWARTLGGNYDWLWRLGMALTDEYKYRYKKTHATLPVLWALEEAPPSLHDSMDQWSEALPAMPDHLLIEVKGYYDVVSSYRNYIALAKQPLHSWTRRGEPSWLKDYL